MSRVSITSAVRIWSAITGRIGRRTVDIVASIARGTCRTAGSPSPPDARWATAANASNVRFAGPVTDDRPGTCRRGRGLHHDRRDILAETKLIGFRPRPKIMARPPSASGSPTRPSQVSMKDVGCTIVQASPLPRSACSASCFARPSGIGLSIDAP